MSIKRNFTCVINNKEHGTYTGSSPSSAARKVVSKLCQHDTKKKVTFFLREMTQGSKKKIYGPYIGKVEKLKEPIELKGRVIKYKPSVKLSQTKGGGGEGERSWLQRFANKVGEMSGRKDNLRLFIVCFVFSRDGKSYKTYEVTILKHRKPTGNISIISGNQTESKFSIRIKEESESEPQIIIFEQYPKIFADHLFKASPILTKQIVEQIPDSKEWKKLKIELNQKLLTSNNNNNKNILEFLANNKNIQIFYNPEGTYTLVTNGNINGPLNYAELLKKIPLTKLSQNDVARIQEFVSNKKLN